MRCMFVDVLAYVVQYIKDAYSVIRVITIPCLPAKFHKHMLRSGVFIQMGMMQSC